MLHHCHQQHMLQHCLQAHESLRYSIQVYSKRRKSLYIFVTPLPRGTRVFTSYTTVYSTTYISNITLCRTHSSGMTHYSFTRHCLQHILQHCLQHMLHHCLEAQESFGYILRHCLQQEDRTSGVINTPLSRLLCLLCHATDFAGPQV